MLKIIFVLILCHGTFVSEETEMHTVRRYDLQQCPYLTNYTFHFSYLRENVKFEELMHKNANVSLFLSTLSI